jgi:hypothetical protein
MYTQEMLDKTGFDDNRIDAITIAISVETIIDEIVRAIVNQTPLTMRQSKRYSAMMGYFRFLFVAIDCTSAAAKINTIAALTQRQGRRSGIASKSA